MDSMTLESSKYHVFLSFRGPDTRQGFTDTLYHHMIDAGIRVFRDDEDQRVGRRIDDILEAIGISSVCMPIFSRGYASSKWCLRELARMVELDKRIIPIFFDVGPDDVKLKTDLYARALRKHARRFMCEGVQQVIRALVGKIGGQEWSYDALSTSEMESTLEIDRWEEALKRVGRLIGRELRGTGYGEFSKFIVKEVLDILKLKQKIVTEKLVGMDGKVKALLKFLDVKAHDIRYAGIYGMGGSGKTTLAKVVFNQLSAQFEYCSFLSDIRESTRRSGIQYLQERLLNDLRGKQRWIADGDDGFNVIRDTSKDATVLIVLDDVDDKEQINKLVGNASWFGPGSRIIMTTRDMRVLPSERMISKGNDYTKKPGKVYNFEMEELNSTQSLQLFSWHAFESDSPPAGYLDVAAEVVHVTGHLPLSLEIVGSYLRGKSVEEWKDKIVMPGEIPHNDIQRKLMISYNSLNKRAKQIFLDVACFFINEEMTKPFYMWRASDLHPDTVMEDLISMSLVKVVDGNKLWMHDHLRDLGREIVRQESLTIPGKRSRLWIHEEALSVLERKDGKSIEAIRLDDDHRLWNRSFTYEDLKCLKNLRFLDCSTLNVTGNLKHIFSNLRWLSWHCCPSDFDAIYLNLESLVILDLTRSVISESWGGWSQIKMGRNLKCLDLSSCKYLTRTPDFSKYSCLERLILEGCTELKVIDSSIGKVKSLKHLNLKDCVPLLSLPEELCSLDALEEIFIRGDYIGSFTLPEKIGDLKSLTVLEIERLHIPQLPPSICELKKLTHLSLRRCRLGNKLPDSLGDLESLVELDLSHSDVVELPYSTGNLKMLKVMKMSGSSIGTLPDSIGKLVKLEELHARSTKLTEIPSEIESLSCLRILDLSMTRIQELPSMSKLSLLQTLNFKWCDELRELPMLPTSLVSLYVTTSPSLEKVPDFSNLRNLIKLMFSIPKEVCSYDESTGEILTLDSLDTAIPPIDLCACVELKVLMLHCGNFAYAPQLPYSLLSLALGDLEVKRNFPRLSHLRNLSYLELRNCSMEGGLESLGVSDLESLSSLVVQNCELRELNVRSLPENLECLEIWSCRSLEILHNLSHLKNLNRLHLSMCEKLREIRGLGEVECLLWLGISQCHSLHRLENLSKLEKLRNVSIDNCGSSVEIEGVGRVTRNNHRATGNAYKSTALERITLVDDSDRLCSVM